MKKMILFAALVILLAVDLAGAKTLFEDGFGDGKLEGWKKYGGNWAVNDKELTVDGVNGPKLMVDGIIARNVELTVEVKAENEGSQAGFVFRAAEPGKGPDAYKGYYAGIDTKGHLAVWGKVNNNWELVASKPSEIVAGRWYKLKLLAADDHVVFYVDNMKEPIARFPKIDGVNKAFKSGQVGLRALGGKVSFRKFAMKEYRPARLIKSYTNPVQAACADPVIKMFDGVYYAYCTYTPDFPRMTRGIRLYTSKNLVDWQDRGFVLENKDSWGDWGFWAPDIVKKDGVYYLYYAAAERMCVAMADTPLGPFVQKVKEPVKPDSIKIDGHVFQDDDGQRYFYYVHFNNSNEIWGGKLNDDMVSVDKSSLKLMVKPDQAWEQHMARVTEGPEVIKHKGIYYLTYSGSHFESPEYAVGYATAESPLGPWKKYEYNPIMKSTAYAHGTAHHTLTKSPDGKDMFIVYHRHNTLSKTEPRAMSIDRIQFVPQEDGPDILEIWGPTSSPQPMPLSN